MRKKPFFSIVSAILLTVLFLIVAFVSSRSTVPDDPGHAAGLSAGLPEREAFFDTNALADFFDENRELFEDTLELVKDNPKMFCIDTWGGRPSYYQVTAGRNVRKILCIMMNSYQQWSV